MNELINSITRIIELAWSNTVIAVYREKYDTSYSGKIIESRAFGQLSAAVIIQREFSKNHPQNEKIIVPNFQYLRDQAESYLLKACPTENSQLLASVLDQPLVVDLSNGLIIPSPAYNQPTEAHTHSEPEESPNNNPQNDNHKQT